MSAAGDALQTLPASVARLRIWTEPTTAAASASAGEVAPNERVRGDVRHHVLALIVTRPPILPSN